ncbi:MAG: hypothetical protein ACRBBO_16900 [Cognatishimia sp.]
MTKDKVTVRNNCAGQWMIVYLEDGKAKAKSRVGPRRRVAFNYGGGTPSFRVCHNFKKDPLCKKRQAFELTKKQMALLETREAPVAAGQRQVAEKDGALRSGCVVLESAREGHAKFRNKCGQSVYFLYDGGGTSPVIAGTSKGSVASGAQFLRDLTGDTIYWRYCTSKIADKTQYSCSGTKTYSAPSEHRYQSADSCLDFGFRDVQLADGQGELLSQIKNSCNYPINVIFALTKDAKITKGGVSLEGYPVTSVSTKQSMSIGARSSSSFNNPLSSRVSQLTLREYNKLRTEYFAKIAIGACYGGQRYGTIPYFSGNLSTVRCSVSTFSGQSVRSVSHPNF